MRDTPEIHYAKRAQHHLAYTCTGDGPLELVYLLGFVSQLDLLWEHPAAARFFDRLGRLGRLVVIDKRGTGLSDRAGPVPIPEEQVDDLLAVMDDVGFDRPALLGTQDGFLIAALLAATAPNRASALVGIATGAAGPEQWQPRDEVERFYRGLEKYWGREDAPLNYFAPRTWRHDPSFRRWWARYSRAAAGPTTAVKIVRNYQSSDIRPILPTIGVPTLVLHNDTGDLNHLFARQLADGIPGARLVELPADLPVGLFPWLEAGGDVADLIEEFLTGQSPAVVPDRVLATVVFTDLVASTQQAAALGDRRWRELLDGHDATVEDHLRRYRGDLIKTTGDGMLATFDGPARALHCAIALRNALAPQGLQMRGGVHTGEVERRGADIGGLAVHIAARVMSEAAPGEILSSSTVKDLVVGADLEFDERGEHDLKGVPQPWRLFAVEPTSSRPPAF